MTDLIKYEVRDGVAHVIIDRPEKRNAMTYAMNASFFSAIYRAGQDDAVTAVIIEGTGGAFCAGTDLSDLNDTPESERGVRGADVEGPRHLQITACPKPVIAAVDGPAMGMGAEFATQCDVRIASTRATFGWVFVLRGLVADTGAGTFLLPRLVGPTEAMRLLMSGETIDAHRALELGFVTQVVEPDGVGGGGGGGGEAVRTRVAVCDPSHQATRLQRHVQLHRAALGDDRGDAQGVLPFGGPRRGRRRFPRAPPRQLHGKVAMAYSRDHLRRARTRRRHQPQPSRGAQRADLHDVRRTRRRRAHHRGAVPHHHGCRSGVLLGRRREADPVEDGRRAVRLIVRR